MVRGEGMRVIRMVVMKVRAEALMNLHVGVGVEASRMLHGIMAGATTVLTGTGGTTHSLGRPCCVCGTSAPNLAHDD